MDGDSLILPPGVPPGAAAHIGMAFLAALGNDENQAGVSVATLHLRHGIDCGKLALGLWIDMGLEAAGYTKGRGLLVPMWEDVQGNFTPAGHPSISPAWRWTGQLVAARGRGDVQTYSALIACLHTLAQVWEQSVLTLRAMTRMARSAADGTLAGAKAQAEAQLAEQWPPS